MSKEDILFSPRAMARVVNHVEWEPEVRYYRDGTSNQSWYIQSMAMLLERWMREFSLPDLLAALHAAGGGDWPGLVQQGLETIEAKVQQFRGFWEGLWYGANPRTVSKTEFVQYSPIPFVPMSWFEPAKAEPDNEAILLGHLSSFFSRMRELSADFTKPTP